MEENTHVSGKREEYLLDYDSDLDMQFDIDVACTGNMSMVLLAPS